MKVCGKCKVEKTLEEFTSDLSRKDGKHSRCKECRKVEKSASDYPYKVLAVVKCQVCKNKQKGGWRIDFRDYRCEECHEVVTKRNAMIINPLLAMDVEAERLRLYGVYRAIKFPKRVKL